MALARRSTWKPTERFREPAQLDDFLFGLRGIGDPLADEVVAAHMRRVGTDLDGDGLDDTTGRPVRVLQGMLRQPIGGGDHDAAVVEFVRAPQPLPPWADAEAMRRGQDLFWTYGPQFGLGLWMASIPSGYAGARDAIVLGESIRCVSDAHARFLETGRFVVDVMRDDGLLDPDRPGLATGPGATDIRHVRLVHALARWLIKERDDLTSPEFTWTPAMGEPVNQMALLATMCTFCVVGVQSLERFGVRITDKEREDYTHLWCVVGHLLGIQDDVLPMDWATACQVWERIKHNEYERSEHGVALTAAAITTMRQLVPGRMLDGFPSSGVRALIGNTTADLLGVPRANWTRVLFWPGRVIGRTSVVVNRRLPGAHRLSHWMGRMVFTAFLELEAPGHGSREPFQLDDELRTRLRLRPAADASATPTGRFGRTPKKK